ncbi:MAG: hypothetical protein WAV38_37205 [Xanthobacteraceae bacterium]
MRDYLADPDLVGMIMEGPSWYGWRVLLIAAAGETLTDEERVEFKRLTGREREPGRRCSELICIFGRRAGKSSAIIIYNIWNACCCDHSDVLAVGEVGVALLISRDQRIARMLLDRTYEIMVASEPLRSMITNKTADTIELDNHCNIEVRPCSYKILRGPTFISVVCDELAFWFTDANFANPDSEVLTAVKPGLLTTKGPILMVSSAYAKTGALYNYFKRYYGANGPDDIIVAYGTSRDMNPSLSEQEIARAIERDPVANRAEYLSEWRDDAEGFIGREVVERNVRDYLELPPQPGVTYRCFIDQASGIEGGDSFAIVMGHKVGTRRVIVDVIREIRPPFNFFEVVNTVLVPLCKAYRIYKVVGDNYAGELAKAPIRKAGLGFELAEKHKSDLYRDPFLGMLNAAEIEMPKFDRAINQICSLERSLLRSGREQITHPSGGHDDCANAIAGLVDTLLNTSGYTLEPFMPDFVDLDRRDPQPAEPKPVVVHADGRWWMSQPQTAQYIDGGNSRRRELYKAIDLAFKTGNGGDF